MPSKTCARTVGQQLLAFDELAKSWWAPLVGGGRAKNVLAAEAAAERAMQALSGKLPGYSQGSCYSCRSVGRREEGDRSQNRGVRNSLYGSQYTCFTVSTY